MANKMRPIHPGEILREEIMSLGISSNQFAAKLKVPANRISTILKGERSITADTALRLSLFFNTSAEFWLNLQNAYDLKTANKTLSKKIKDAISHENAA